MYFSHDRNGIDGESGKDESMTQTKKKRGRPAGSKNSRSNPKAKEKAREIQNKRKADRRVMDEIWSIIAIALGVFLVVATLTNGAGQFGKAVGDCLKGLFGFVAYILPFYLIVFGILLFAKKAVSISVKTALLLILLLFMFAAMNSVRFADDGDLTLSWQIMKGFYSTGVVLESGGFFGMILATLLIRWFGVAGCWIFTGAVTIVCLLLIINTPVSRFISKVSDKIEERKLIKENAHLDTQSDMVPEGEQVTIRDINGKSRPIHPAGTGKDDTAFNDKKRPIKIVDGSSMPENDEPDKADEDKKTADRPAEENSVLRYMKTKDLFGKDESSGTYGLEEKENYGSGYGIDGVSQGAVSGFGLTGDNAVPASAGMGMTSYETPAKEQKMSNKEAREAMLSADEINIEKAPRKYKKPPVTLLDKPAGAARSNSSLLTEKARKLEETLRNFHVDARVMQVIQGPTVTRYEIQPAVGVKVSSIVRLADDIALNLEAKSIRIEAPIPGKAAVGIEVENDKVTMVHIREVIDSQEFKSSRSKITFAVGKNIGGKAVAADLKAMPHLLIAGATGSGKSVCINSIIVSLLYKANPDEVKLILIDPKVVELGNYNGIPHLMIPVVTDPAKAAAALNWAVSEMTDRYKKFAEEGVRDLESYNEYVKANGEEDKVMPQVVIIIDELADLMMAAPSQIEESICRLAQMARAAGMHLIVATQRPSVDVITGVIKANIPSRIAFAVSSQVDSRTILDMQGAEKLVGKGDMLFNPMGIGKPVRIQGTFISDNEVHKVIEYVKGQVENVDYNEDVLTRIEKNEHSAADEDGDELLSDAIDLVVKSGQASVSMLQRRFRIGYNRAARIMDMMEARGIVAPQDGSRPRQVLLTEQELEQMKEDTQEI